MLSGFPHGQREELIQDGVRGVRVQERVWTDHFAQAGPAQLSQDLGQPGAGGRQFLEPIVGHVAF
jgi:hypothetical protein